MREIGIFALVLADEAVVFVKTHAVGVYHSDGLKACQERLQHDREATTLIYALADKITAERLPVTALDNNDLVDKVASKVVEALKKILFSEHLESS